MKIYLQRNCGSCPPCGGASSFDIRSRVLVINKIGFAPYDDIDCSRDEVYAAKLVTVRYRGSVTQQVQLQLDQIQQRTYWLQAITGYVFGPVLRQFEDNPPFVWSSSSITGFSGARADGVSAEGLLFAPISTSQWKAIAFEEIERQDISRLDSANVCYLPGNSWADSKIVLGNPQPPANSIGPWAAYPYTPQLIPYPPCKDVPAYLFIDPPIQQERRYFHCEPRFHKLMHRADSTVFASSGTVYAHRYETTADHLSSLVLRAKPGTYETELIGSGDYRETVAIPDGGSQLLKCAVPGYWVTSTSATP